MTTTTLSTLLDHFLMGAARQGGLVRQGRSRLSSLYGCQLRLSEISDQATGTKRLSHSRRTGWNHAPEPALAKRVYTVRSTLRVLSA